MSLKPLKTAKGYYDRAWKVVIKAQRPHWKGATITKNLAWLWASRTQAEEDECNRLVAAQSIAFPTIDQSILPAKSVAKADDPPHPRAAGRGQGGPPVQPPQNPPALNPPAPNPPAPNPPAPNPPAAGPAAANSNNTTGAAGPGFDVNSTQFSFWPRTTDSAGLIPAGLRSQDERWRQIGLLHPDEPQDEEYWYGDHVLGEGSGGRATAWVKVDENETIVDTIAVKDSRAVPIDQWTSPFYWRDCLPRDIAIQKRLDAQSGLPSIHKFRGYRLSMPNRCYRVYNDLCEQGTPLKAFEFYSRQWRIRRDHFRLEKVHDGFRTDEDHDKITHLVEEDSFPDKSDDLDVIPEKFLWRVFENLVDACILLRDGAGKRLEDDRPWRPIIHRDLHLSNVFLKLLPGCTPGEIDVYDTKLHGFFQKFCTPNAERDLIKTYKFLEFTPKTSWPTAIVADFDTAFFDLQGDGDSYADNPLHYFIGVEGRKANPWWSRYAPELFADHQRYRDRTNPLPKMTSAVDVFGIGVMMWNLVRNLPGQPGWDHQPCFDSASTFGRRLVNGQPYTQNDLDTHFLTGQQPFEACARYSEELTTLVKGCLAYRPEDRMSLEELKNYVDLWKDDDTLDTKADGPLRLFVPLNLSTLKVGHHYRTGRKRKRDDDPDDDSQATITA